MISTFGVFSPLKFNFHLVGFRSPFHYLFSVLLFVVVVNLHQMIFSIYF